MNPPSKTSSTDTLVGMTASRGAILLREFDMLSGGEILERILRELDPRKVVEEIPAGDLFWLLKKIGRDESHPLLELAAPDQWQYLLDMEIWDRDEVNAGEAFAWLERIFEADSRRTVLWLLEEGVALALFLFQKSIEVVVREEDDKEFDVPDGFFTHDGVLYLRAFDPDFEPFLQELTGLIAAVNLPAFQTLMSSLAGVIPTELEEGMYRMRNVRLAEHGFLPFEESFFIYSPLASGQLNRAEKSAAIVDVTPKDEGRSLVPFLPLHEGQREGFLQEAVGAVKDPLTLERLRLEFAGLANQIASAEGLARMELDRLVGITRKAAGYLNIALETLTGKNADRAGELLGKNPLVSVFRTGFGFVLGLKQEAETWLRDAWFRKTGFEKDFWGDERSSVLSGLLQKKPVLYTGLQEGELYRDFAGTEDLATARRAIRGMMALDGLLDALTKAYPPAPGDLRREDLTGIHYLLTFWARFRLRTDPGFAAITPEEARAFFSILREGEKGHPYQMTRYREVFLEDMLRFATALPDDLRIALQEELSDLWENFRSEYEDVSPADTDMKHTPFLFIT